MKASEPPVLAASHSEFSAVELKAEEQDCLSAKQNREEKEEEEEGEEEIQDQKEPRKKARRGRAKVLLALITFHCHETHLVFI